MPLWNNNEKALIKNLRTAYVTQKQVYNKNTGWKSCIRCAVSGNTFRTFRNKPNRPSRVFRTWAYDALVVRGYFKQLVKVQSQQDYDKWFCSLVNNFEKYWKRKMGCKIPFGASYKLPNLLMKYAHQRLTPRHRKRILRFLHIPLDSYTLVGLCNCIKLPNGRRIPMNATMGFVKKKQDYKFIQKYIENLASQARVPKITYDYLAWNNQHEKICL